MGIASLIIGIICLILGGIPFCNVIILLPSIVGIILGIIAIIINKQRGLAIAGLIMCIISILIYSLVSASTPKVSEIFNNLGENSLKSEYRVGETAQKDGLKITLKSVENYVSDNPYSQPNKGNKFIKLKFEFENIGSSDQYASIYDFEAYVDNTKVEQRFFNNDSLSATLSQNKKSEGYIYFEVPSSSNKCTVEYQLSVWTSEKVVYNIDY
ncbi:MAG TPA: DUF4352 domain-containing protein [Clostridia bacterium]|nr:DUF4352 domain-containing protein [Clostridia bacterium]